VIVLLSMVIQRAQDAQKPPVIFDLVAGPPTSPFEKEAPALGVPNPVKFTAPKVQPKLQPQPVEEEEEDDVPVVKSPPKQQPKAKDDAKKLAKDAPPKMSYDEFKKKHGEPKVSKSTTPRSGAKVPRIDTKGIAGGVKGGSTSNNRGGGGGNALTREDMAEMDIYITGLKNRLKAAHDEIKPQGLGDTLSAEVEFFIAANGEIGNVRIVRSSGNAEFDASVREAFRRITLMGMRPDKKSDSFRLTFRMREED
jgi:colicin import membrane protein